MHIYMIYIYIIIWWIVPLYLFCILNTQLLACVLVIICPLLGWFWAGSWKWRNRRVVSPLHALGQSAAKPCSKFWWRGFALRLEAASELRLVRIGCQQKKICHLWGKVRNTILTVTRKTAQDLSHYRAWSTCWVDDASCARPMNDLIYICMFNLGYRVMITILLLIVQQNWSQPFAKSNDISVCLAEWI